MSVAGCYQAKWVGKEVVKVGIDWGDYLKREGVDFYSKGVVGLEMDWDRGKVGLV